MAQKHSGGKLSGNDRDSTGKHGSTPPTPAGKPAGGDGKGGGKGK